MRHCGAFRDAPAWLSKWELSISTERCQFLAPFSSVSPWAVTLFSKSSSRWPLGNLHTNEEPQLKATKVISKSVCYGFGGATSRDCLTRPTMWNTVVLVTLWFRFQAQDDAGGPERRRPDQSLPSAWSQAEERQRHWTEGVGPAEQNLPLPDLRRPRELWDPTETGSDTIRESSLMIMGNQSCDHFLIHIQNVKS